MTEGKPEKHSNAQLEKATLFANLHASDDTSCARERTECSVSDTDMRQLEAPATPPTPADWLKEPEHWPKCRLWSRLDEAKGTHSGDQREMSIALDVHQRT